MLQISSRSTQLSYNSKQKKENEKGPVPNGIGSLVLFVQSPIPVHRRYPLLSREAKQSGGASGRIYTFIFILVRTHDKAHHCALRSYRPTAARCSRSVISQTPIGIVCYHSRHRGGLLMGNAPLYNVQSYKGWFTLLHGVNRRRTSGKRTFYCVWKGGQNHTPHKAFAPYLFR